MNKFYLVIFFVIFPLGAEAAEISGDVKSLCPFGQPFFVGPMDPGKSFELLTGHTKAEKAKIKAYRQVLTKCVSQYGKRTKFVLVGFVDPILYRGRPEVHNGLNGGLAVTRAISAARLMRELGYQFTSTREVHGENGDRGVLFIPDLGLCTADDINDAIRIVDEITGQTLSKSSCKVIVGQQLPVGRITKVKISLRGDETFDGVGRSVALPTTKTCYVVVGEGGQAPNVAKPKETQCSDGLDNDGDGLVDCADPDCEGSALCGPENSVDRCKDGIDNDGDGFVDCDDADCNEYCKSPASDVQKSEPIAPAPTPKEPKKIGPHWWKVFQFFVSGEIRYGILDKSTTGPFQGVSEVTDQIKIPDMFNGILTVGAYHPLKNGWFLGGEFGVGTTTSLYALQGSDELLGHVHQKKFLVRGGVLKHLNNDLVIGVQVGTFFNGTNTIPLGRISLQLPLTDNFKLELAVGVENTRHVQTHQNVWTPQLGLGLVYWF